MNAHVSHPLSMDASQDLPSPSMQLLLDDVQWMLPHPACQEKYFTLSIPVERASANENRTCSGVGSDVSVPSITAEEKEVGVTILDAVDIFPMGSPFEIPAMW
jgi:hypothetical protein